MFGFFHKKVSVFDSGLLQRIEDRHSHILYGVDDGVSSESKSLEILSILEEHGLKSLWLTPHVMEDVPNTTAGLRERFEALKAVYKGGISLHLAAEYMIDSLFSERLSQKDLISMDEDHLLVETSTWSAPYDLYRTLDAIMHAGYRPLLAHPERYRYMDVKNYEKLVGLGVHLQLNLPSLTGLYGEHAFEKASFLLDKGWYSAVGSDCHCLSAISSAYSRKTLSSAMVEKIAAIAK